MKKVSEQIRQVGSLDSRSLALCRICLATLLLWDLGQTWLYFESLLLDEGIVSRDFLRSNYQDNHWTLFGIWFLDGVSMSRGGAQFVLSIHALAIVSLLIGFKTRWAAVLVWLFTIQLHNRNPYIIQGADTLIRTMLFWFMFLPSGRHFSIDARGKSRDPEMLRGARSFFFTAQFALMYILTWWLKDHPFWNEDHSAVYFALHYDQLATPLGIWLRQFEALLPWLTRLTYWTEILAPVLLLVSTGLPRTRLVLVFGMVLFHISLASALLLAHFPWACAILWLAFLPESFWGSAASIVQTSTRPFWKRKKEMVLGAIFLLVLSWNVRTVDFQLHRKWFPRSLNWTLQVVRLDQYWSMFAPFPSREDGWFVITARTEDGRWHDLLRDRKGDFARRPEVPAQDYPNGRWSKLYSYLRDDDHPLRSVILQWLQDRWDQENPENPIVEIRLEFIEEFTPPP